MRHENFNSAYVPARQIDVWLPQEYEEDRQLRLGALYVHDGQNLFDPATSYSGVDWGIIPAMRDLIAAGIVPPTMVIGIWNSVRRWEEYLPQRPFETPKGKATLRKLAEQNIGQIGREIGSGLKSDAYLRFIVEELKPFIDQQYRTLPGREHTWLMGSSMGSLISLYGLCRYPQTFGGAGCLSTHWPAVDGVILEYLAHALPEPGSQRIYFDYGSETLDALYEPYQRQVDNCLRDAGYQEGRDWITRFFPGADHSESSWRERVHIPLVFLLSGEIL